VAKANAIRAGRAFVEIFADSKPLMRGLKAASAKLKAFGAQIAAIGKQMMMVGAAIAAPLALSVRQFMKMGDQLNKMAARTGVGVKALSLLRFVAEQAGTNIGDLEKALKRMQRTIFDAGRGLKETTDALAVLGLTYADLEGKTPGDQFALIAKGLGAVADASTKAALAQVLLGRAGTMILPMLDNMAAKMTEAEAAGLGWTKQEAAGAAALTDSFNKLWAQVKRVATVVGGTLAGNLADINKRMGKAVKHVREWVEANRDLIIRVAKVAAALIALGAATFVIGKIIALVGGLIKAVYALGVALTFLVAHPVVAALVAIGAIMAYVIAKSVAFRTEAAKLTTAMMDARAAADKKRAADKAMLDRLEELSNKTARTNDEMAEAAKLTAALESRYGDLGITVDKAAKSISGVADAQERASKLMREAAEIELDQEYKEIKANLAKLTAAYKKMGKEAIETNSTITALWRVHKLQSMAPEMFAKMDKLAVEAKINRTRRAALRAGSEAALTGPAGGAPAVGAGGAGGQEAAKGADLAARVERLKLGLIKNRYTRERALLDAKYRREREGMKGNWAAIIQLQKAYDLEVTKLDQERAQRRKKIEADMFTNRLAYEKQLAEEAAGEAARTAEEASRIDATNTADIEELRLRATMKGYELEKALLALREKDALAEAKAAGASLDLVRKEFALRGQILGATQGTQQLRTAATAFFNPAKAQGLGGQGDKRELQAVRRGVLAGVDQQKKTNRLLEKKHQFWVA